MESLRTERQKIRSELKRLRAFERDLQGPRPKRFRKPPEKITEEVTNRTHILVLLLYWIAGWDPEPPAYLLEHHKRLGHVSPASDRESATRFVEDLFLATPLSEWIDYANDAAPKSPALLAEAWTFFTEWQTRKWVDNLNHTHGIAPETQHVLEKYNLFLEAVPPSVNLLGRSGLAEEASERMWAMRWRRRWGGRVGDIKAGEVEPLDVLREKVSPTQNALLSKACFSSEIVEHFSCQPGSIYGTAFGTILLSSSDTVRFGKNHQMQSRRPHFWDWNPGLILGTCSDPTLPLQADVYWQWFNHNESKGKAAEKPILRINMDETSVCLYPGQVDGNIFARRPKSSSDKPPPRQQVGRAKMRTNFTLCAFLCDNIHLQPYMPQVIIVNDRTVPDRDLEALCREAPEYAYIVKSVRAWNCVRTFLLMIAVLGLICRTCAPEFQVIFIFDCAPMHLDPCIFRACLDQGFYPMLVPAKTTWLLQPLDAYGFQQFKRNLKKLFQWRRAELQRGALSLSEFFQVVYAAIELTFHTRSWDHAFARLGLGDDQASASKYICQNLQRETIPCAPATALTDDQALRILPGNRRLDAATLTTTTTAMLLADRAAAAPRRRRAPELQAPIIHPELPGIVTRSRVRAIGAAAAPALIPAVLALPAPAPLPPAAPAEDPPAEGPEWRPPAAAPPASGIPSGSSTATPTASSRTLRLTLGRTASRAPSTTSRSGGSC